jgi:hypothetical protein
MPSYPFSNLRYVGSLHRQPIWAAAAPAQRPDRPDCRDCRHIRVEFRPGGRPPFSSAPLRFLPALRRSTPSRSTAEQDLVSVMSLKNKDDFLIHRVVLQNRGIPAADMADQETTAKRL